MSDDLDTSPGLPVVVWLVIGLLAVIGVVTVVGWAFSLVWGLVRLAIVAVVVVGVVYAVRAFRSA